MSAILFGSISTLADTSEMQREAFNEAFAAHQLDWRWEREEYRDLLKDSGGAARVAAYAASRGQTVDAAAVHATKSEIYRDRLAGAQPRAGVVDVISRAKEAGLGLGFVTTTARENLDALFAGLAPEVSESDFGIVVAAADDLPGKPDPASYQRALDALGEQAADAVAIEDNLGGLQAASAAGVACVAFPNANTAGHDFAGAERTVSELDFDALSALARSK